VPSLGKAGHQFVLQGVCEFVVQSDVDRYDDSTTCGFVRQPVRGLKHLELVRSLGADVVIDYTQEDFTTNGKTYDVIFDAVGKTSFWRCRQSLRPGGLHIETDLGFGSPAA